ncbi:Cellular morphogenesis regulator [Colletotrichum higginsianum IMI 349063]|uniref:Cellular morphogenesis regulator n=2 Tax=Colletotrichum higginsianum (strain IMI 349063) TaxID=759273 RepID=A0A1B7YUE1_COLHI|nr:Cellular morphogenesis regulator [Colletotrichum higginsianum IMI 349063]OBR15669.1 Cellular morphogenesis regulator [Colletotrichum higginsianum IMI 349063]
MALEPGSGRRSVSPESSGRESPLPRQWRNQLGAEEAPIKDKHYRKYASGIERALSLFETALQEWADYISFLNRLLKALQARHPSTTTIPSKAVVAKRLSQCLNPSLPSGVHQKALEVYSYIFATIGTDGLSKDLPLYLPGLASTLSFASLSVRSPFLDLLEHHFLDLDPRSLRPAMKSVVLALLPGLEDETSEDFDRTLRLMDSFKAAIRPVNGQEQDGPHSSGDGFFWQCFFLASITGSSRRAGALAYLVRNLPKLGEPIVQGKSAKNGVQEDEQSAQLAKMVTSPEPGLLLRSFAAGLADEQLLIQRGFLDLLVTHLPLHSKVLQTNVKPGDLELLLRAAVGVVIRRDMSLNRRLWAWFLGPDPAPGESESGIESPSSTDHQHSYFASKTSYFEDHGLQPLTRALLSMINVDQGSSPGERARPYRICLSLMDRWEIGGLVVPEVFLPIVNSVRQYRDQAPSKADFNEVFRSASVFFDGVESGLIYGEIVSLLAQAIGPGTLSDKERLDKLDLVNFILANFNVREEEMVTIHAPLTALSILCMLEDTREKQQRQQAGFSRKGSRKAAEEALHISLTILDLIPDRAFPSSSANKPKRTMESGVLASLPAVELLKRIKAFYVDEQGNLDAVHVPLSPIEVGELLLQKSGQLVCEGLKNPESGSDLGAKGRILTTLLLKVPTTYQLDTTYLLSCLHERLGHSDGLSFVSYNSILYLSSHLYSAERIELVDLTELVTPLVRQAWEFLSASEPKHHVETVRSLWQLQTALSSQNRDIEAALASLIIEDDVQGSFASRPADAGRRFSVLWSHTLQDSSAERRGSRTPMVEKPPQIRMSGSENYEVMLTRPLFLMLDALLDERTQLFMTVKGWLNSLVGIDKLFLLFVRKFSSMEFLRSSRDIGSAAASANSTTFTVDDDLDLCLYYLRTLSNVLRWAPDVIWAVLGSTSLTVDNDHPEIAQMTGSEGDISMQEVFIHVCLRCIAGNNEPAEENIRIRATQLHRYALTVMHQILLNPYAEPLASLHLEDVLIERLLQSLSGPDPYVQVLLLDVVFDALKLRDIIISDVPASPSSEKRKMSLDPTKTLRVSTQLETKPTAPPPNLLKCLQAGLSSPSSRSVLDSWVSFLTECLPFYSDTIFQVLIPLVETLCRQVSNTFNDLQSIFRDNGSSRKDAWNAPESTLISLLNALEQVLARAHERLLAEEARTQVVKGPDQHPGFFGNMVSGVFNSDAPQTRSATANDRLTVHLAFADAVRICFTIWSWGQGSDANAQDMTSISSFNYTSLRMRNRARRLLEHLFAAETLECLETVIDIWRSSINITTPAPQSEVFNLLPALDGSRPKHTIPAIFNAIYSRTNPGALDASRKSTLTTSLQDIDLVTFLVEYARTLEDDAMDEIWLDCMAFLRDLLTNPFPHRQTLPSLLEFAAILGEKVDNTNFGEQRKMRRELGDLFLRLLTAIFTTKPMTYADAPSYEKSEKNRDGIRRATTISLVSVLDRAEDVVAILASIVPNLPKILVETDRVLSAAGTISTNVISPAFRAKAFPDTVSKNTLVLLQELSRLPNNQKTWKKDVGDAFNDARFFSSSIELVRSDWLPLLRQWTVSDKERMPELLSRMTPPTTAGIVFGVGATSARLEADRKTQLNLRRTATLVLASSEDAFVAELPTILDKVVELLGATATSSPSSTMRAEIYMVVRALVLKTSAVHLAMMWPVINAELHAAISSVVAPDHSTASDTYNNTSILQACKLLDLLICVAPDDFQLHEWLFVTDTVEAVYRSTSYQPVALVDELAEELGTMGVSSSLGSISAAHLATSSSHRRPLLGAGGINDEVGIDRKDELVGKILRPFFGQLSIFAFESTYAMAPLDREFCILGLLKDLFDERSVVKAL